MFSEKDFWNSLPDDLQLSLGSILDRYQRHLMMLEAEVAELKNALPQLYALLAQQSQTASSLSSLSTWPHQGEQAEDA